MGDCFCKLIIAQLLVSLYFDCQQWPPTIHLFQSYRTSRTSRCFHKQGKSELKHPNVGIPPSLNKKEAVERFVTLQKPNSMVKFYEQEHQWHCYQLHCMYFSKGKTSLCSTVSVPCLYSKIWSVLIFTNAFTD